MSESEAPDDDGGRLWTALTNAWNSLREFHEGYSDVRSIHAARDAKRHQDSATAEHGDDERKAPADDTLTDET